MFYSVAPFYMLPELDKIRREHEIVLSDGYCATAVRQIRSAIKNDAIGGAEAAAKGTACIGVFIFAGGRLKRLYEEN